MPVTFKYLCFLVALFFAFQPAFGQLQASVSDVQSYSRDQFELETEHLKKQINNLFEAYNKGDTELYVGMAHQNNFRVKNEGQMSFVETVRYIFESNSSSHSFSLSEIKDPIAFVVFNEQLFGVVSFKLEKIIGPKKDEFIKFGSMIGVSEDKGKSWEFVNGRVFNDLFPDIAGIVPIQTERFFLNGTEQ